MAVTQINGRDYIVMIDPAGGTAWKTCLSLTENGNTNSVTELDGSSKSGNVWLPGKKFEATMSGNAFIVDQDTGTPTDQGYPDLYTLFVNRVQFTIRFGKAAASVTTGDFIYTGSVFITQLEVTSSDDELVKFDITFRCANPPFTQTITY